MSDDPKEKLQQIQKIKKMLYIAAGILILLLLMGQLLFFIHSVFFLFKTVNKEHGPEGVCPYNYYSLGLKGDATPILSSMVDQIVGIVYANKDGKSSGLLKSYRNNILENSRFQTIKIMLIVLVIAFNGAGFVFGFLNLTTRDILQKLLVIVAFMWATQPGTYALYDDLIEPLVLQGTKEVSAFLAGSVMHVIESPEVIAYADAHYDNEFLLMDAILKIIFSKTVFDKIGSLLFVDPTFRFLAPILYLVGAILAFHFILFTLTIIFYKLTIVVGLSLFPIFVLFAIFKAVGKAFEPASQFFGKYIQEALIKPSISIIISIYAASFLAAILLNYIAGALNFKVCIKNFFRPPAIIGFLGDFNYISALKPQTISDIFGNILFLQGDPDEVNITLANTSNYAALYHIFARNILIVAALTAIFKHMLKWTLKFANSFGLGSSLAGQSGAGSFRDLADKGISKVSEAVEKQADGIMDGMEKDPSKPDSQSKSETGNPEEGKPETGTLAEAAGNAAATAELGNAPEASQDKAVSDIPTDGSASPKPDEGLKKEAGADDKGDATPSEDAKSSEAVEEPAAASAADAVEDTSPSEALDSSADDTSSEESTGEGSEDGEDIESNDEAGETVSDEEEGPEDTGEIEAEGERSLPVASSADEASGVTSEGLGSSASTEGGEDGTITNIHKKRIHRVNETEVIEEVGNSKKSSTVKVSSSTVSGAIDASHDDDDDVVYTQPDAQSEAVSVDTDAMDEDVEEIDEEVTTEERTISKIVSKLRGRNKSKEEKEKEEKEEKEKARAEREAKEYEAYIKQGSNVDIFNKNSGGYRRNPSFRSADELGDEWKQDVKSMKEFKDEASTYLSSRSESGNSNDPSVISDAGSIESINDNSGLDNPLTDEKKDISSINDNSNLANPLANAENTEKEKPKKEDEIFAKQKKAEEKMEKLEKLKTAVEDFNNNKNDDKKE